MSFRYTLRIAFLGILLAITFQSWVQAYSDRIVAVVNKEVITLSELKNKVRDEHIRLRSRFEGTELRQRMAHKEYEVLNDLIEERLQLQEARAKGFTVTEEELDKGFRQFSLPKSANTLTEADRTEEMRKRILLEKIREFQVRRIVTISDSEISQHYKNHQDRFLTPPTYRLRQILFVADSEDERMSKLTQARSVYQRLQEGESFRELALRYSAGPEASEGGELGVVRHDELLSPIAKALRAMKPGDVSAPIETTLGFHIIVLDESIPQKPRPLEDVEEKIKARLYKQRSSEVFQHWLADLKKKAFIEIKYSPLSNS